MPRPHLFPLLCLEHRQSVLAGSRMLCRRGDDGDERALGRAQVTPLVQSSDGLW
jgi:hypothetical protein